MLTRSLSGTWNGVSRLHDPHNPSERWFESHFRIVFTQFGPHLVGTFEQKAVKISPHLPNLANDPDVNGSANIQGEISGDQIVFNLSDSNDPIPGIRCDGIVSTSRNEINGTCLYKDDATPEKGRELIAKGDFRLTRDTSAPSPARISTPKEEELIFTL